MSTNYRQDEIRRQLAANGRVRVEAIAQSLDVSTETIRRDLTDLEAKGLVRRIHGGAVPFHVDQEPTVAERARVRTREKSLLGAVAADLAENGMSIFIDAGSTQSACARHLIGRANLTVTTNSLDIAASLSQSPGIRVRVAPGIVRKGDNAMSGQDAISYIERFAFDLALVGIGACDSELGWMDFEEEEANLRRLVLRRASRLVILADSSKFGRRAAVRTYPITQALTVATDRLPPAPFSGVLGNSGVSVLVPKNLREVRG
ncbi:DeoR family transcriptional regulator [Mesorhizobium tianshanense]|uniref:DeoR family transcriptional regulator n=1 Tax=Mesorhizobium tianshanense TaxID=39844 RepID=A0A562NM10_9HYPH|nr:DeoR/GlpR family DNA-binding transcription regulator [Mesorhizobium tianshanense]TWI33163.1 DeoR family transcriptional regulator [Mesorhizobium tianshanense]GLS34965.1 DeoR family transcriptional regulator [Mesorhizobium tianshanense]